MNTQPIHDSEFMSIPSDLASMVQGELTDGEKLVWTGRPLVGRIVLMALPLFLFGIPFTAFAVVWMGGAGWMGGQVGRGGSWFALFGLPFVMVGLALVGSPVWYGYKASKMCYALTDRRAIIWEPIIFGGLQIRSYVANALGSMVRNQRGDGSGDLIFEEIVRYSNKGRRSVTQRGFLAINDVRDVDNLIRATLLSRK